MSDYDAPPTSPVMDLYARYCAHAQKGRPGWSWLVFNANANAFVLHLIRSGIPFTQDDLRYFLVSHRGTWQPLDGFAESAYAAACTHRNDVARKALDAVLGREPFILWTDAGNVDQYLAIGDFFLWQGERVLIDSFNDRAGRINVSVRERRWDPFQRSIRITHEAFCAAFAKPKRVRKTRHVDAAVREEESA
jgi:hypothetical protein